MSNPPSANAQITDSNGYPTRPYYRWFSDQAQALTALQTTVAALPSGSSDSGKILGGISVQVQGILANGVVKLTLLNDATDPGNTKFYGTSSTGSKGWHAVSDAFTASANIALAVGTDGVITPDLTDATISTGGTLKKRAFDAKGRLSNESAATTDDLGEGSSNLYFTAARASSAAPIQSVVPGANIEVDNTDPKNPIISTSPFMPTEVADGTTFSVPQNVQIPWTVGVELLGSATLDISGTLVEVA